MVKASEESELSSREDEFCFNTVQDKIQRIHKEISGIESERNDKSDIVMPNKPLINQNGQLVKSPGKYHLE